MAARLATSPFVCACSIPPTSSHHLCKSYFSSTAVSPDPACLALICLSPTLCLSASPPRLLPDINCPTRLSFHYSFLLSSFPSSSLCHAHDVLTLFCLFSVSCFFSHSFWSLLQSLFQSLFTLHVVHVVHVSSSFCLSLICAFLSCLFLTYPYPLRCIPLPLPLSCSIPFVLSFPSSKQDRFCSLSCASCILHLVLPVLCLFATSFGF